LKSTLLDKGYGTNGGVIGEYLGCMLHHQEISHFKLFSSPSLA
jgi:hypothetical protein